MDSSVILRLHFCRSAGTLDCMPISTALDPPARLLCGPGPSDVEPSVLDAMRRPMLGHLDPTFHAVLDEVTALLREVWRMPEGDVFALPSTGTSAMEAGIVNLLEPGDTAIIAEAGFFGSRLVEIAERHGVNVVRLSAPWGQTVPNAAILDALDEHSDARLIAVVHAETSTGALHPLRELGTELFGYDVLLMADCVTSLGGVPLDVGRWGVDYAYSCTQKCLAAPPGMAPVAISPRAWRRIHSRRTPVPFSLDLELLRRYWAERPAVYHHTTPILGVYALHEALRRVLEEGLDARWARHAAAAAHLQAALRARGLELLADPLRQMAPLTAVRVPEGIDGKAVQTRLLDEFGIEIGGGLGPDSPAMWRIGLMGHNATVATATRVLSALDEVLEPVVAELAIA
jgi:alanine-glyoxylate transaminase/serine-glyoxylate transaminase/serine-pyruvate transaminase